MKTKKTFPVPPFGMGATQDKKDTRDFKMEDLYAVKAISFPKKLSHLNSMSPIKHQGQRGACVSFGTVAVKEWQEKKQRKLKTFYDLSEEFLYEQIKLPGGGAFLRDAFKAVATTGVCQEKLMPYINVPDNKDTTVFKASKAILINARNYMVESYARIEGIDGICQSLAINGPCITGLSWPMDWFWPDTLDHDSDGFPLLKKYSGGNAGGHCPTIIGYDYDARLFEMRNSWGLNWGLKGYARISFDVAEEFFWDTWGAVDVTSKKISLGVIEELKSEIK